MTDDQIAEALALCEAATPGEWSNDSIIPGDCRSVRAHIDADKPLMVAFQVIVDADAEFIAAARTGWPAALEEVKRLRRALDAAGIVLGSDG